MRELQLTKGLVALVDDEDYDRVTVFKWHAGKRRDKHYAARSVKRKGQRSSVYLHRFIVNAEDGVEVDHRNRNPLDCQKHNLRVASRMDNACNVPKLKNNTSGYKGVRFNKGRWEARINVKGVTLHLGRFDTAWDAGSAYDAAAKKYHGEFAYNEEA